MAAGTLGAMGRQDEFTAAWRATRHDPVERLKIARTTTDREVLAIVAPEWFDHDAALELVHAVLGNPVCSGSIAGRYVGHRDAGVRLLLARRSDAHDPTLQVLALDLDDDVRAAARAALDARPVRPMHGV
ncbi:hypothetical protein GCM10025864_44680 [Luteimicrobium album]|uniref:Uncharacterized protein n=1 Tax=Luteimicrobium album TaxID=1054550 RepID=A0ABQ6I7E9_9MICO|nr:hypothetical protein GCM10025864_44680 [Luteimicrobium album]